MHITRAENDEVSKLLGTAFGLSLATGDTDEFLLNRIIKFLGYWSSTKINSIGRGTMVNGGFVIFHLLLYIHLKGH